MSTSSVSSFPSLVRSIGQVKAAAAGANVEAQVLDADVGVSIASTSVALIDGTLSVDLQADPHAGGGGIAVHQELGEVIADAASAALGRRIDPKIDVAASQSTADVLHTATRLAILADGQALNREVSLLAESLRAAGDRFGDVPTLARTCLQDALAVPARMLVDGSAAALDRRAATLSAVLSPLVEVVLGATVVGDGTGAPERYRRAVVPALAALTGLNLRPHPDPASALQHGDDLADISAAVVGIALVAAKLAQDLRLLSSGPAGGFGEVRLPKVAEGSAFFATKNNPVTAETVIAAAARVQGNDAIVRSCLVRAELHLAGHDLSGAASILESFAVLTPALAALRTLVVDGMELDEDRCRELAGLATGVKEAP